MNFGWEQRAGKQHFYKKRKQIRYLNVFNIINILILLNADAKSAMLLRVPSLINAEVYNFPLLHFSDGSVWLMDNFLCFYDVWIGQSYANFNVSVSSIFSNGQFYLKHYFLHHRNLFPLKRFSQVSIARSPFSFFTKILKRFQFFIFTALGGTSQILPKNIPCWRQQTDKRLTEISFLSIFFKMLFYIIVFSILAIGKQIDM